MNYTAMPTSVRSLEQRIRNVEGSDGLALRRRVGMALVVVGQMLPDGAIKGGSAMALRYGRGTRFTQDLDAARVQPIARFRSDFEDALSVGWSGFTGRLVEKSPPRPPAVPRAYVMQPFEVKIDYRGRPWCTVKFELGHNEIGDADEPEYQLSPDLVQLFMEVGLEAPKPVAVMRSDHQVAQKLHAVSSVGSERAHDLVDLQLLDKGEDLDLAQVAGTCSRLFDYRRQQAWPPIITPGTRWDTLYIEATDGLDVLPVVEEAVAWVNNFVQRIVASMD
ncbi:nucleotidyl transferase AbiEii/AbiGii toxin family protein [Corynebacterium glyciniphilum]|uniref:nucleotidyl transferase AbiEii/AbiGii toxin family protein n=1 Tax=Corynebacterium glyciniphilum TaxID=1404244 RepID=UPI001C92C776|nr:nucleotidyl transferase AbiEii/AbiGii toxin family protein [Corynebacterium glyciniphilum]